MIRGRTRAWRWSWPYSWREATTRGGAVVERRRAAPSRYRAVDLVERPPRAGGRVRGRRAAREVLAPRDASLTEQGDIAIRVCLAAGKDKSATTGRLCARRYVRYWKTLR